MPRAVKPAPDPDADPNGSQTSPAFTLALRIAFAMQRAAPSPSAHGAVM